MIVQISIVRDELPLIKELLPIWSKYSDGFIFYLDTCTDGTLQYLTSVSKKYNILEIINKNRNPDVLDFETDLRQRLFDAGRKFSDKIICLDADEYLDGEITKDELIEILESEEDVLFHLKWIQYTSCNTIRIDGPWKENYKDRIGRYTNPIKFNEKIQNHSTHLPIPNKQKIIDPNKLFISHLQWVDKTHVSIKQYYWKVVDYVSNIKFGAKIVGAEAYDASVNNFNWEEEYFNYPLKISPFILEKNALLNYRLEKIKELTTEYNIPNLGDWNLDIVNLEKNKGEINPYKISIITAIGNIETYGKFVQRYLNNVIDQHMFLQTEHIIVYSEWSDIFNIFKKYSNFKLIQEGEKLGMYNAWNIGIKAATTDYVTNWNVDDLRHPINTKYKYDLLKLNNEYEVAYNYYVGTNDINENFYNIDLNTKSIQYFPDHYELYAKQSCLIGPDPMWKKSLHDKAGMFDITEFGPISDWEMWIRFSEQGVKFKLIPEVLCLYYDHPETVSNINAKLGKDIEYKTKLIKKYN